MPDLIAYPDVTAWLGSEVTHWKNRARRAEVEVERLRAELAEAKVERDAERSTAMMLYSDTLPILERRAERAEAARDALKAAIERTRAVGVTWMRRAENITGANEGETFPDLMAIRDARAGVLRNCTRDLLAALGAPESHGDGRTPQTQGASEGREANEAQEASQ
jgi:hypothetical protein